MGRRRREGRDAVDADELCNAQAPQPVAARGLGARPVGATLVVALLADAVHKPGDHKGRPYKIICNSSQTSIPSEYCFAVMNI
jgi:hypothetical protein